MRKFILFSLIVVVQISFAQEFKQGQQGRPGKQRQFRQNDAPIGQPGEFDLYVLSISWSPAFCASKSEKDPGAGSKFAQCKMNSGFVLHGLWPQAKEDRAWPQVTPAVKPGTNPQFCDKSPGAKPAPFDPEATEAVRKGKIQTPPGNGLARHEWEKHGTCSGLDQAVYFQKTAEALEKLSVPAAFKEINVAYTGSTENIEQLFIDENPSLSPEKIVAKVDKNKRLYEMLICFDKDLNFTACRNVREPQPGTTGTVLPNIPLESTSVR